MAGLYMPVGPDISFRVASELSGGILTVTGRDVSYEVSLIQEQGMDDDCAHVPEKAEVLLNGSSTVALCSN